MLQNCVQGTCREAQARLVVDAGCVWEPWAFDACPDPIGCARASLLSLLLKLLPRWKRVPTGLTAFQERLVTLIFCICRNVFNAFSMARDFFSRSCANLAHILLSEAVAMCVTLVLSQCFTCAALRSASREWHSNSLLIFSKNS